MLAVGKPYKPDSLLLHDFEKVGPSCRSVDGRRLCGPCGKASPRLTMASLALFGKVSGDFLIILQKYLSFKRYTSLLYVLLCSPRYVPAASKGAGSCYPVGCAVTSLCSRGARRLASSASMQLAIQVVCCQRLAWHLVGLHGDSIFLSRLQALPTQPHHADGFLLILIGGMNL